MCFYSLLKVRMTKTIQFLKAEFYEGTLRMWSCNENGSTYQSFNTEFYLPLYACSVDDFLRSYKTIWSLVFSLDRMSCNIPGF